MVGDITQSLFAKTKEKLDKMIKGGGNNSLFKVAIDESMPVFEQAYTFFKPIYGLDDVKRGLYQDLLSTKYTGMNTALIGAPATAKSLFVETIRDNCNDVIYFNLSIGTSAAGVIQRIKENPHAKIIVFDEVDKGKKDVQHILLQLMESGEVKKDLKGEEINVRINAKMFFTTNSIKKLSPAFKSRVTIIHLPEYKDDEFINVVTYCLNNVVKQETAVLIAQILLVNKMKNVRLALRIANRINDKLTEDEIIITIEDFLRRATNENVDYN